MKKVKTLLLTLILLFNISPIVLAQEIIVDNEAMLLTIERLSANPRGFRNDEIKLAREFIINEFEKYGLEVTTQPFECEVLDWDIMERVMYEGVNIIATKMPNTPQKTNDILIIGSHYDGENDTPAANDNGSGVAVMLELARVLKDLPTDTEIRFVAFDAEESSLKGSQKYIEYLDKENLNNIVGMLNFDMLAGAKQKTVKIYSADEEPNYLYYILKNNPNYSQIDLLSNNRSDHLSFYPKVIPNLAFSHDTISGEYHSKGDTIENISVDMLIYAVEAGYEIAKEIMSEKTPSFQSDLKPKQDNKIYQIAKTTYIPIFATKTEIEKVSGIKFTQVPSDDMDAKFETKVRLFDIDKIFTLTAFNNGNGNNLSNLSIDIENSDISFEELYEVFTKEFGEPKKVDEYTPYYIWNSIYGNSYEIRFSEEENSFNLRIDDYNIEGEAYSLINGELIRMEEQSSYNSIGFSKRNGEIISEDKINKPSDILPVTGHAKQVWEKLSKFMTEDEINKIGFIWIHSNGLGISPAISMKYYKESELSLEQLTAEAEKLEEGNGTSLLYPISGIHVSIDYIDLTNELGSAYNEKDFLKSIDIARAELDWSFSAISEWAAKDIVKAIEFDILPSELQTNYKSDITKGDFCELAFSLLKSINISELENINKNPFTDTENKSILALYNLGIIRGKSETEFESISTITREEASVMLDKMYQLMELDIIKPSEYIFDDNDKIADYAKQSVYNMKSIGIINGVGDDVFAPKDKLTRQEAIISIVKLFEIIK